MKARVEGGTFSGGKRYEGMSELGLDLAVCNRISTYINQMKLTLNLRISISGLVLWHYEITREGSSWLPETPFLALCF